MQPVANEAAKLRTRAAGVAAADGLREGVGDAVTDPVGVIDGVGMGKHNVYVRLLHNPGCRAVPTQHPQQKSAFVEQSEQVKPVALREMVLSVGVEVGDCVEPVIFVATGEAETDGDGGASHPMTTRPGPVSLSMPPVALPGMYMDDSMLAG